MCPCHFQDLFGDDGNNNGFRMFDSSNYHGQDLLFKDDTVQVVPVGQKTTYQDWLGPDYVAALEGMLSQQCSGAGRPATCWTAGRNSPRTLPFAPAPSVPYSFFLFQILGSGRYPVFL